VFTALCLASVGASLGLRRMYVKALLKIFEYATNIKQEKTKECEELVSDEDDVSDTELSLDEQKKKQQLENSKTADDAAGNKEKKIATLKKLRLDSFKLDIKTDNSKSNIQQLNETDRANNNYLDQTQQKVDLTHQSPRSMNEIKNNFQLDDVAGFAIQGLKSIIDDDVTKRFTTKELGVWNLLSRTNQQYEHISFRVTVMWALGFLVRYCLLFPTRLLLFIVACTYTFISTFLVGQIGNAKLRGWLNHYGTLILHRMLSRVFSAIITIHNKENRAQPGSICVANHTSPIDVIILSTDNSYSMIGQRQGGFTGMMQRAFSRASRHIWFDRSESRDRHLVARRMREHCDNKQNMPILIFPEGTCINNTSVMMFKKGCFEVETTIYPVAIKYDLRFGDAFWNSNKHSMLQYLILMMTSWAIVVDVYYLPPMTKQAGEDAAHFASRVKAEIVKKGSFVDLHWDGMLKRTAPKMDLMYEQQQKYVSRLKLD